MTPLTWEGLVVRTLNATADQIVGVLDDGEMDYRSRESLAGLYRRLEAAAAGIVATSPEQGSHGEDDEGNWCLTWFNSSFGVSRG